MERKEALSIRLRTFDVDCCFGEFLLFIYLFLCDQWKLHPDSKGDIVLIVLKLKAAVVLLRIIGQWAEEEDKIENGPII